MRFLGELLQVLHWALMIAAQYMFGFVGLIAFIVLSAVGIKIFGDCFLTIWSNRCFDAVGHSGYDNMLCWAFRQRRASRTAAHQE